MLSTLNPTNFKQLYTLMTESFPPDEHRDYDAQQQLLSHPQYKVYIHTSNHELGGFFATWEGEEYIYLEHFAVKETLRNSGLGSKLLESFLQQQTKPVVIEIEEPTGELEKRRAAFYVRNGFHLSSHGYDQPAFSPEKNPVPMKLMSYPNPLQEDEFQRFYQWIFTTVYE